MGGKSWGKSFGSLADVVKDARLELKRPEEKPKPPAPAISKPPESPLSDEEAFEQAMAGVERQSWQPPTQSSQPPAPPRLSDAASEERRLMQAAMDGNPEMGVIDHPEYIEGWVGVTGKRFLPNLRTGLYSIQDQIDLHGLTRAEAQIAVEDFVIRMSRFRSCCIKIIHGRGINSPNDRAVLKENLQKWLTTRRMSRHVVAYASAPLKDGGVGAIYVLLRRT